MVVTIHNAPAKNNRGDSEEILFNFYRENNDRNTKLEEPLLNGKDSMIMKQFRKIKCFGEYKLTTKESSSG